MTDTRSDYGIWVERHRPQRLETAALPSRIKKAFQGFLDKGDFPNLLLTGPAGCGKTTMAKALCRQLDLDVLVINASEERNIDVLRTTIKGFASTMSFGGGLKVVILDEADGLNPQTTQPALRAFIEEFAGSCRFILTANYKNRLIEPLHSRMTNIDFYPKGKEEKAEWMFTIYTVVTDLLKNEGIPDDGKAVAKAVNKYFPDIRKLINDLQTYASTYGKVDAAFLNESPALNEEVLKTLYAALAAKSFQKTRVWVAENLPNLEQHRLFRLIFDASDAHVEPDSMPTLIYLLGKYSHMAAFSQDAEINFMSFCVEAMAEIKFK